MRYLPGAPNGVMEFLFIETMLLGTEQGYEWFSLGMASLAGISTHRLAPLWNRLSHAMVLHGERFAISRVCETTRTSSIRDGQPSILLVQVDW
ncbi:MAG: DUF2156 domain-containing protein [Pirellulaceae bacterium]|nr:DUF2156 domain-containing protein [Pirellulaceae bacterium]